MDFANQLFQEPPSVVYVTLFCFFAEKVLPHMFDPYV